MPFYSWYGEAFDDMKLAMSSTWLKFDGFNWFRRAEYIWLREVWNLKLVELPTGSHWPNNFVFRFRCCFCWQLFHSLTVVFFLHFCIWLHCCYFFGGNWKASETLIDRVTILSDLIPRLGCYCVIKYYTFYIRNRGLQDCAEQCANRF